MLFNNQIPLSESAKHNESSYFEFLLYSNDPECILIRQWIEEWFDEIPSDKKSEFESRLKAKKDETFKGALFELQIHRMLKNLGLKIEVEPDLPGTGKKIDFRVHLPNQESQRFYLEAANCIPKESKLEGNLNEEEVINEIKKEFPNPHTDVWIETEGILKNTLGKKRVTKPIREFLEKYPPQEASQMYDISHTLIEDGNWNLKACFKQPLNPLGPARIYGPFRISEDETPPLKRLEKKAKKWKNFDFNGSPFIIAVNALTPDFFLSPHGEKILFSTSDGKKKSINEFRKGLHYIDGIIFVDNAKLSTVGIRDANVQLFKNGERNIPECLHFLLSKQRLGTLLGIRN